MEMRRISAIEDFEAIVKYMPAVGRRVTKGLYHKISWNPEHWESGCAKPFMDEAVNEIE